LKIVHVAVVSPGAEGRMLLLLLLLHKERGGHIEELAWCNFGKVSYAPDLNAGKQGQPGPVLPLSTVREARFECKPSRRQFIQVEGGAIEVIDSTARGHILMLRCAAGLGSGLDERSACRRLQKPTALETGQM
jgi:hypothetical protein